MITFTDNLKLMTAVEEPLVLQVIEGIKEVKGHDVVLLDLRKITAAVTDYFVICTGDSPIQVDAISDSVLKMVEENTGETPISVEGRQNRQWVILDYADVVVHIFLRDRRDFYKLEELWGDAGLTAIEE